MKFKDIQATIHIDLTKSIEELWQNLNKKARWGVKKAKDKELIVKKVENDMIWNEFYEIYKDTCKRGGIVPLPIERIKESKLFICEKNNKIIAGAAIKEKQNENKIELFLNASLSEYLYLQPNNLLYWNLIKYGKTNGFEIFDLGGYQLKASEGSKLYEINKFKERWGGKLVTCQIYSKNPFYILGRKIIRNFAMIKNIRDKIKIWLAS